MAVEEMLTVPQAAKELGLGRQEVSRKCQVGILRATKVGRDYLIRRTDLERFKKRRAKLVA